MSEKTDTKMESALDGLKRTREGYKAKAFRLMVEMAFIFGLPAIGAYFGGRALDLRFNTGKLYLLILLAVAFILSWTLVILIVRKLNRELRDVDARIKSETDRRRAAAGILKPYTSEQSTL